MNRVFYNRLLTWKQEFPEKSKMACQHSNTLVCIFRCSHKSSGIGRSSVVWATTDNYNDHSATETSTTIHPKTQSNIQENSDLWKNNIIHIIWFYILYWEVINVLEYMKVIILVGRYIAPDFEMGIQFLKTFTATITCTLTIIQQWKHTSNIHAISINQVTYFGPRTSHRRTDRWETIIRSRHLARAVRGYIGRQ